MTLLRNIFLGLLIGLILAFGFDSLFLHLLTRPRTDQILLLLFSTTAFGYLAFYVLSFRALARNFAPDAAQISPRREAAHRNDIIREHAAGMIIAIFFFAVYLFIGLKLNHASMDTVDNYLDADNTAWMARIAAPDGSAREMRGPHPFAYFIFRPLGWVLNLFTRDYGLSVNILNTFVGGLCVFLAWLLIYNATKNKVYASLIALLFGLSTAQSFFGSVVETYIFSAAALLGFFVLLQTKKDSLFPLVLMSVVTFGITLTNFVQTFIGFVISRAQSVIARRAMPDEAISNADARLLRQNTARNDVGAIIRYAGLTLSIGVLLSLIHAAWFTSSKLFFIPSDAAAEETFAIDVFQDPQWKAIGRVMLLVRTILFYTVIAPKPYVFTSEVGGTFPRFNFFRIAPEEFSYSSYSGLGTLLIGLWALLLLASGIFFLWNLIRTRKLELPVAFALCILFNFLLHLNYGYEPFLYSPDWAYALILFVGLSLAPLAKNRFFQGGLLLFLLALAYNQFEFFQFVFKTVAPFIGQGG